MLTEFLIGAGIEAAKIAVVCVTIDKLNERREKKLYEKLYEEVYKEMHEHWFNCGWEGAEKAYKREARMYQYLYYKAIGREDLIKAYGLDKEC